MRAFWLHPPGKLFFIPAFLLISFFSIAQQPTFPVNGVADPRTGTYAFTHATIVKDGQTTLTNATLIISDGKIIAAAIPTRLSPKDAVEQYVTERR